jgi:16S rRNA processing protein RimM
MPTLAPDAWVALAEVARPHGVRGELRLRLYNEDSDVLLDQEEVLVRLPDGAEHEVSVDFARRADRAILMKLHSVDDRNRAEEIRGAKICVRRRDFPPLEAGEFYACDVEGAEVRMGAADGELLGTVREFLSYPSVDALLVEGPKGRFEVPVSENWIREVVPGRVVLATLDGIEVPGAPREKRPDAG